MFKFGSKQKAASIFNAKNALQIVDKMRKEILASSHRNLQQRIGNSNNNRSIEDLVLTVCICTFLLRCYPVANNLVEGHTVKMGSLIHCSITHAHLKLIYAISHINCKFDIGSSIVSNAIWKKYARMSVPGPTIRLTYSVKFHCIRKHQKCTIPLLMAPMWLNFQDIIYVFVYL